MDFEANMGGQQSPACGNRESSGKGGQHSPGVVRWNLRATTGEGMATNFAFGLVNPFISVFAIALGAGSLLISMLSALPALANVVTFIVGPPYVERHRRKLPFVFHWATIHRFFYLAFVTIIFLPAFKGEAFVLLFSLSAIPAALCGLAWTDMMGYLFPERQRSELFAKRNVFVGFAGIIATFIAGYELDLICFPYNYVLLFCFAFVISLVGLKYLKETIDLGNVANKGFTRTFRDRVRALTGDPEFGAKFKYFALSCTALWSGFGFTAAMWPIYHVNVLHLPNKIIGMLGVVSGFVMVLSYPYWGRLSNVKGERWVLLICMGGLTAFTSLYVIYPNYLYLMLLQAAAGAFTGGLNLAVFNLLLAYAKAEERANATGVFNAMLNGAAFIAPFIGNMWYERFGLYATFHTCTAIRFMSMVLLWRIMETKLPGKKTLHEFGRRVLRGPKIKIREVVRR
ncbi:MAG: MFS transporter [Firmicutes bacterium]|nr:MFS transporter [Bacillota bacterium]